MPSVEAAHCTAETLWRSAKRASERGEPPPKVRRVSHYKRWLLVETEGAYRPWREVVPGLHLYGFSHRPSLSDLKRLEQMFYNRGKGQEGDECA